MNDTVDRKYILVLAALAVGVLAFGALRKPKKMAPEPPSPSETASLQARLRRDELAQTASYFAQRSQALAQGVIYDREHDSSAVAWEKPGQVLTTRAAGGESFEPPLILAMGNVGQPPPTGLPDQNAGHWVLIVGRTADRQLLWTPAVYGGTRQSICAGEVYRELIVNAGLDSALSGAGAFDLDGMLVGIVANCEGAFHVVSAASIPSLLKAFATSDKTIASSYGFRVAGLTEGTKSLFSLDSGLFVTEVRQSDAADQAGLKAGDVITSINAEPIAQTQQLWRALESEDEDAHTIDVRRNRRKWTVRMPSLAEAKRIRSADASLGIRILPVPRLSHPLYVAPGTPAYEAGLRTGDHLIQIGENPSSGSAALSQAISAMGDKPLLVVYQRNRTHRAALVSP